MDQAQQEYPPGTVGYLAQRRGWDTRTSEVRSESEPDGPESDTAVEPVRGPRVGAFDRPSVSDTMPVPEVGPEHAPHRPGTVSIPQQQSRDQRTREHQPREYQSREHQSREHQPREYQPRDRRTSEQLSGEQRDPLGDPEDDPFAYFAPARPYLPAEPYQLVEPRRPVDSRREVEFGGAGPRSDAEAGPSAVGEAASGEAAVGEAAAQEVATPEVATPEAGPAEPRSASRSERSQSRAVARWVEPGALAAQQAQRARTGALVQGDRKAAARRSGRRVPTNGWRRMLFTLSGGLINPGEGPVELRRRELTTRVNQPLHGCYKVAMLSLKGGVGKTTVTATLGATFASLRGDRVIAVDANPDRGTLSQKIPLETSATVSHLLRDSQRVRRYIDVRAYTSQGPSRLEVLASEQDPAVSEAFSEQDYRRAVTLLEHFYNIVLTDCGTGLMHSAMYGVLGMADALVIVSSGSIDGARSASATMDWLDAHGHRDLVSNSVAVINSVRRSSGQVDLNRVAEHFAARCRAVVRIPYDSHLEEGAELDVDRLAPATRTALLELAASVADVFPRARE